MAHLQVRSFRISAGYDCFRLHGDANQNIAASSLFSVSDADGDAITKYQFWDSTSDPLSGHFVVGGVAQGTNQYIDVTAAQLCAHYIPERLWIGRSVGACL